MQRCPCYCANTFIVLALKVPLILAFFGHLTGNLNFLISCNFAFFYPIEMGFSPEIIIFYTEKKINIKFLRVLSWIFILMPNLDMIYDVTIAVAWDEMKTN